MAELICAGAVFIVLIGFYYLRQAGQRSLAMKVTAVSAKPAGTDDHGNEYYSVVFQVVDGPMKGETVSGAGSPDQIGHTQDGLFDPKTGQMRTLQHLRSNYKFLTLSLIAIIALYIVFKLTDAS